MVKKCLPAGALPTEETAETSRAVNAGEADRQYATTLVQLAELYSSRGDEELGASYISRGLSLTRAIGKPH